MHGIWKFEQNGNPRTNFSWLFIIAISCIFLSLSNGQTETVKWGTEEVCQWLDLVGLGSFKQTFKDREVTGYMLLHMDVKLFSKY